AEKDSAHPSHNAAPEKANAGCAWLRTAGRPDIARRPSIPGVRIPAHRWSAGSSPTGPRALPFPLCATTVRSIQSESRVQKSIDITQVLPVKLIELSAVCRRVLGPIPPAPVAAFRDQQLFKSQV